LTEVGARTLCGRVRVAGGLTGRTRSGRRRSRGVGGGIVSDARLSREEAPERDAEQDRPDEGQQGDHEACSHTGDPTPPRFRVEEAVDVARLGGHGPAVDSSRKLGGRAVCISAGGAAETAD